MCDYRLCLKIKSSESAAAAIKVLRKYFPDISVSELRAKLLNGDYIYSTEMAESSADGEFFLADLFCELDTAGVEVELWEGNLINMSSWKASRISRKTLHNMIESSIDIYHDNLIASELEIAGDISPQARTLIEEEVAEYRKK